MVLHTTGNSATVGAGTLVSWVGSTKCGLETSRLPSQNCLFPSGHPSAASHLESLPNLPVPLSPVFLLGTENSSKDRGVAMGVGGATHQFFYPCPLQKCGSSDGHFLLLLHTTNFLFLLDTENAMGGVGPWLCMPSCFMKHSTEARRTH